MNIDDYVKAEEAVDWVQRAENDDTALIAHEMGEFIERHFDLAAFLHESEVRHTERINNSCKWTYHENCLDLSMKD